MPLEWEEQAFSRRVPAAQRAYAATPVAGLDSPDGRRHGGRGPAGAPVRAGAARGGAWAQPDPGVGGHRAVGRPGSGGFAGAGRPCAVRRGGGPAVGPSGCRRRPVGSRWAANRPGGRSSAGVPAGEAPGTAGASRGVRTAGTKGRKHPNHPCERSQFERPMWGAEVVSAGSPIPVVSMGIVARDGGDVKGACRAVQRRQPLGARGARGPGCRTAGARRTGARRCGGPRGPGEAVTNGSWAHRTPWVLVIRFRHAPEVRRSP
jgi:hypothetical protein